MPRTATAALAVLVAGAPAAAQIPQPDIASPVTVTAPDHVPEHLRESVAELRSSDAAWDRLAPLDAVRLVDAMQYFGNREVDVIHALEGGLR